MKYLFRGKVKYSGHHLHSGDWIEGNYVYSELQDKHCVNYVNYSYGAMEVIIDEKLVEIDSETLGMWTGLKNNDREMMYEGDIIRDEHREENGKIVYDEGGFKVIFGNIISEVSEYTDLVVIGNIHDNPELLEGDE